MVARDLNAEESEPCLSQFFYMNIMPKTLSRKTLVLNKTLIPSCIEGKHLF